MIWLGLRRFTRGGLPIAALVVLAVVPLLYGALYLAAFWDPQGRLDRIPVALVDQDVPVTASDGSTVHAGADLATELLDREVFGWRVTDETTARRELADGEVHLMLRIPAGFSAALAAGPDATATARQARLEVVSNDAVNYLSGQFARTAFGEIRAAASASASGDYFDRMLVGFTDLKQRTGEAADGARQLDDGLGTASGGAGDLATGLDTATGGAAEVADGTRRAAAGADRLADGLATLDAGAGELRTATAQAAAAGRELAGRVDRAADTIGPELAAHADEIASAATAIADGADLVAANLDALTGLADAVRTDAHTVIDRIDALVVAHPELAGDPALTAARAAAATAAETADRLAGQIGATDLAALRADMTRVAATARAVADAAPGLAGDLDAARTQIDAFAAGLDRIAGGADRLSSGLSTAAGAGSDLSGGLYQLSDGTERLSDGLVTLDGGGHELATGLVRLRDGADRLAGGLADGAGSVPGYTDAAARAGILADPVGLDRSVQNRAATYGVGFAPYFLGLALWVGTMITFMLLRPVERRHVHSGAPGHRVALAGLLPAAVIGLAQVLVLFAVVVLAVGLEPVHPWRTLGLLTVTSVAFVCVQQAIGAWLGTPGRLLTLALLMLQLTSSGGTYPVETSPAFFRWIHPYLPLSYVVDGLRHAIDGGGSGPVLTAALVLGAFAAGGFALTVAAVVRGRVLTPGTLHPSLVM
ncbi:MULTISPECIES: YhgE/Pip domain-containing protein [Catenuloplanes]|uniref:Membrane protein n=1 Tax=Catenuloplanes niger TaxID=587534 RepID=A0AAE3ZW33_9ACTN|nr:YhgE/Pip domain-containing protein [Catenuloplanes niger]MDR7324945.1 putative membrane protein [Catenuloplanes niger]